MAFPVNIFTKLLITTLALLSQAVMLPGVQAQPYPAKPVRLIVPATPGAATDVVARLVAESLGERLGVAVIVDNRGGAAGVIGTELASRSAANGYTLMFAYQDPTILIPLLKKVPYNMKTDFAPVAKVADLHYVIVANAKFAAKTLKELIDIARAQPDGVKFSSAGNGGINHLAMELLQQRAGMKLMHIPYKGIAAATTGLLAGDVDVLAAAPLVVAKAIKDGQLCGLAITQDTRSEMLPSVPTASESGFPGFFVSAYLGIVAPAGVPQKIVEDLSAHIVALASAEDFRRRLTALGVDPGPMGREEFARFLSSESRLWREVIERGGIKLEE